MKSQIIHLQYFGTCHYNNRIWFPHIGFNGLFSINTGDLSVKFEYKIPCLREAAKMAYAHAALRYDSKLFFFPGNCRHIFTYDVNNSSSLEIDMDLETDTDIYSTAGIVQNNDKVWIFPQFSSQGVYTLNLSTLQIEQDVELSKLVESIGEGTVICVCQCSKTEVAISRFGENYISVIDIEKKKKVNHKIFEEKIKIQLIFCDRDSFWILQSDSTDIYEWKQTEDRLIKYCLTEEEWIDNVHWMPYRNMIFFKEHIIILNCKLKYIMKIDKVTQTIKRAIDYPKGFDFLLNNGYVRTVFASFDVIDNKIWIHPSLGNMLLIYDVENNHIEGKEIIVTAEQIPYWHKIIDDEFSNDICLEVDNPISNLDNFLHVSLASSDSNNRNQILNIGEKIYCEVREG